MYPLGGTFAAAATSSNEGSGAPAADSRDARAGDVTTRTLPASVGGVVLRRGHSPHPKGHRKVVHAREPARTRGGSASVQYEDTATKRFTVSCDLTNSQMLKLPTI